MLHFRSKPLPEKAEAFLSELAASRRFNTCNLYRSALHHFHRFLTQSKIELARLTPTEFAAFDEDLERHHLKFATRRGIMGHVHAYLRWLETRGDVPEGFSKKLFPNYHPEHVKGQLAPLPELALRFLEVLGATNKPNTVKGYQSCLRAFYRLHWKTGKLAYKIERSDTDAFMIFLKERGMGVNQRRNRYVQFRRYLDWLKEHGKLKAHPDDLITSRDIPRPEEKLPRPFPVDVDIEIQRRLAQSNDIDHLGILLMRRCGLRVGELLNLKLDCIGQDLNGHYFLKVPLGKLNNERIFPLDPYTVEVVEKIKRHHEIRGPQALDQYLISAPSGKRRGRGHFGQILLDITRDLTIPGKVTVHRLRHSFATSLLSAGLSITTLKILMGHRDIRMTLNYAAVTQETVRNEYFTALTKIRSHYEVASYPLKVPDLRVGVNRAFYDTQRQIKKFVKEHGNPDPVKLRRLLFRLNMLRHDFSVLLKIDLG